MTAAGLFLVGFLISAYLVFSGFLDRLTGRRMRMIARTETTRSHFARARQELMYLARQDQLDVSSQTFRALYDMTTFGLRRPDEYELLAEAFVKAFRSGQGEAPAWIAEREDWPEGIREVFAHLLRGTFDVMRYHSGWPVRLLITKHASAHLFRRVEKLLPWARDQFVATRNLESGRRELERFAMAT
jgi:hypothetical protein